MRIFYILNYQEYNMSIIYDNKRKDITFVTMLFKIPQSSNLDALKSMNRKFDEFYLPSLKKLIETFQRVALWCDVETAEYLKKHKLDKNIDMRVMDFTDLPHIPEKQEWLNILHSMQGNVGYLFHNKTPQQWIDYLMVINAKPSVLNWAATRNKFKTKYFMWIDAGSFHPMYSNFWADWDGAVHAHPKRVRITIAPTLGKSRPHFVPNFIYRLYRKLKSPILPATKQTLVKQKLLDIAMINADYDVPACSIMATGDLIKKFYQQYETVRLIMKNHGLVSTEQAVFQAMMKFDTTDMFELAYIHGYTGVYAGVAKEKPDCLL